MGKKHERHLFTFCTKWRKISNNPNNFFLALQDLFVSSATTVVAESEVGERERDTKTEREREREGERE